MTGPATADLAGELRTVVNRLAFLLRTPATRHGLTPTRLTAMVALHKTGAQRPGDLATMLGITAASMSRLTEALEAGGWVVRTKDPDDHRACRLELTAAGTTALNDLRHEGTSELSTRIDALTTDQQAALAAAVPVLSILADLHLDT